MVSIRFRKYCAGFTHFVIYNNEPNVDCKSCLLQYGLADHVEHISIICNSFSGAMEVVLFVIPTNMPKQIMDLVGETAWSCL